MVRKPAQNLKGGACWELIVTDYKFLRNYVGGASPSTQQALRPAPGRGGAHSPLDPQFLGALTSRAESISTLSSCRNRSLVTRRVVAAHEISEKSLREILRFLDRAQTKPITGYEEAAGINLDRPGYRLSRMRTEFVRSQRQFQ